MTPWKLFRIPLPRGCAAVIFTVFVQATPLWPQAAPPRQEVDTAETRSSGVVADAEVTQPPDLANINDAFLDPELDPKEWMQRFEIESREIYAARSEIVESLELQPGNCIADIGAGTGLFLRSFSDAVGKHGRVFAVDISPRLTEFMRERVKVEKLANVEVVLSEPTSARLADHSVDIVFVCDTYHHFLQVPEMLASLRFALRSGGRLVVIDFERIPNQSRDWVLEHVRADKQTFRNEIEKAGFVFEREIQIPDFKENYMLRFRRP